MTLETHFSEQREKMIEELQACGISGSSVLRAMTTVPRHNFVSKELERHAYGDHPLPIHAYQTISQPFIVAKMMEAANLTSDSVVLEIGTGCGYQSAILAELCKAVYTVERIPQLGTEAQSRLFELGYTNVHFCIGDGYLGWPSAKDGPVSPFDSIIVSAGAKQWPQHLLEQLKVGGMLVVPISTPKTADDPNMQELLRVRKTSKENDFQAESLGLVRFVPMIPNTDNNDFQQQF